MSVTLTAKTIDFIKPDPAKRLEIPDRRTPGLYFIVQTSGKRSWAVRYRRPVDKRPAKMTLGAYPAMGLGDAREAALAALNLVERGTDPAAERAQKTSAAAAAHARTDDMLDAVVDDFIERYAKPKNKSWPETRRIFDRYILPAWPGRRVQDITRRDVIALVDGVAAGSGPYMANRVLAAARKFFAWCAARDLIADPPTVRVQPPGAERTRDRVLSDAELAEVWTAAGTIDPAYGAYVRALMLTAQRRTEVAGMRWADLQLDGDAPQWVLPREQTKADRLHEVPLAPAAVTILEHLPRHARDKAGTTGIFAFTTTQGRRPIAAFDDVKKALDAAILAARREAAADLDDARPMPDWRLHDLRRSAASTMARLGFPPHVVAAILNHSPGSTQGVTAIYLRHRYGDEKRAALAAWAAHVSGLVEPREGNVVPIRATQTVGA